VHHKDSNKIFSFTSEPGFTLERISTLVLRDVQQASFLKKTKKFETTDFDMVKRNIEQIQNINKSYVKDPCHSPRGIQEDMDNHYLMCQNNNGEPEDNTVTETIDESMAE